MIPFISAAIMISTSPTMPVSPPPILPSSSRPPIVRPSPPPTESWVDKMWRRYQGKK